VQISSILLVLALLAEAFIFQSTVNAQSPYVTVYGQLEYYQCASGPTTIPLTPCQSYFYLSTNGTTPGLPTYPVLDFSQSVAPAPTQSDVGKMFSVIGYYGQEHSCPIANGCPVFLVHTWSLYYQPTTLPTSTGCFSSSNPPTTWYSTQCGTAPTLPLGGSTELPNSLPAPAPIPLPLALPIAAIIVAFAAYLLIHRKK